ncbi:MAG TPA: DUF4105 domain-containing protein [Myxococcaceae bacterium]|nr:DUF4105 domain-containing protein [Myxococcaceae bacterium]
MLAAAAAIIAASTPSAEGVAARISELEVRFRVRISRDGPWTTEDLDEIAFAFESLPEPLRNIPGGRLELIREPGDAPFGIARVDGVRLVLRDMAPPSEHERHAERRLSRLDSHERRRLWRRRSVVHALIRRWDEARGWSAARAWRSISGWIRPLERPFSFREHALNVFPGAFSRRAGMDSAALDLATFAEEALVPAESIRAGAVSVDESVRCQEHSKFRFLIGTLMREGLLASDDPRADRGSCPAFDAWAAPDTLSHAEVLYVASSGRAPESLFGHLLLRLERHSSDPPSGPSFGTAVQLVALTGSDPPDVRYLARGLTGGYQMAILTTTQGDLWHQMLEAEQRTIRRFRLRLSRAELLRLVERIWELERRGYFEYWFFSDNCASLLAFLLDGALEDGRRVRMPSRFLPVAPASILDALAETGILEPTSPAFESVRDRADRAEPEREEALRNLLLSSRGSEALVGIHRRVADPRLAVRRSGWRRLIELTLEGAQSRDANEAALLERYWRTTVRIERYAVEAADAERRQVLLKSVKWDRPPPSSEEDVEERQRQFEREDALARRLAILDRMALADAAVARAPKRPLSASEEELVLRADALADGFTLLTDLHGRAIDAMGGLDSRRLLGEEDSARDRSEREWSQHALRRSGFGRIAVGPGLSRGGATRPTVVVETAALDERLGEQRVHGFQASSEIRALAGRIELNPRWGAPEVTRSTLTLLGYRTIRREVPTFRSSLLDGIGWGGRWIWEREADRSRPERVALELEGILVPFDSANHARFTALSIGASAAVEFESILHGNPTPVAGPRLALEQRLPFGRDLAGALVFEASWRPTWDLRASQWSHAVEAAVTGTVRVSSDTSSGILLRPRVMARALSIPSLQRSDAWTFGAEILVEPGE